MEYDIRDIHNANQMFRIAMFLLFPGLDWASGLERLFISHIFITAYKLNLEFKTFKIWVKIIFNLLNCGIRLLNSFSPILFLVARLRLWLNDAMMPQSVDPLLMLQKLMHISKIGSPIHCCYHHSLLQSTFC